MKKMENGVTKNVIERRKRKIKKKKKEIEKKRSKKTKKMEKISKKIRNLRKQKNESFSLSQCDFQQKAIPPLILTSIICYLTILPPGILFF